MSYAKVYVTAYGGLVDVPKEAKGFVFFTIASGAGKGRETTYTDCAASHQYAKAIVEKLPEYTKGRRLLIVGNQTDRVDEYNGVKRRKKMVWLLDFPQFLDWQNSGAAAAGNADDVGYSEDSDVPW